MSPSRSSPESPTRSSSRPKAPAAHATSDPASSPADSPAGSPAHSLDPLACFHPVTTAWFHAVFEAPTAPQRFGWPVIARGESTLILAPTGTGKTLTAFLWCLDRLMLESREEGPGNREHDKAAAADPAQLPLTPDPCPLTPGRGSKDRRPACRIVYVSPLKALA
ncbi:MAG TPA: DEAD/DEAH box helicase, partial [Terracidiphilus sp.]|nr:DEAD/DEAH box helicase [Terracidiphilus sp.]